MDNFEGYFSVAIVDCWQCDSGLFVVSLVATSITGIPYYGANEVKLPGITNLDLVLGPIVKAK